MRTINPKYFFPLKFSPKSRFGLYANAGYTILQFEAITKTLYRTAPHRIKPSTALTEIPEQCRSNSAPYRIQWYLHFAFECYR